jgi:hypothetical protein
MLGTGPDGAAVAVPTGAAVAPEPPAADCGGHPDVDVAPTDAALCDAVVPPPVELVAPPPGEVAVPAGVAVPSVPAPPREFPPVSTVELT